MTVNELLFKVKHEKPNSFSDADLISYLNEIEMSVAEELALSDKPVYSTSQEDMAKPLLVPAPYDALYVSYLKSRIDFANEEMDVYANDQAQFNQDFSDFSDWVVRTAQAEQSRVPRRFRNTF